MIRQLFKPFFKQLISSNSNIVINDKIIQKYKNYKEAEQELFNYCKNCECSKQIFLKYNLKFLKELDEVIKDFEDVR